MLFGLPPPSSHPTWSSQCVVLEVHWEGENCDVILGDFLHHSLHPTYLAGVMPVFPWLGL